MRNEIPLTDDAVMEGFKMKRGRNMGEKGVALITVVILMGICIALVTTLIYMVTVGTKASGSQKRYKSALEASYAGLDVVTQIIAARSDVASFLTGSISTLGITSSIPAACSGTAYASGLPAPYSGITAKIMTASSTWVAGTCGDGSMNISSTNYDFIFPMGTNPQFNVYAKIVDVVEGNTGAGGNAFGHKLYTNPVASTSNEIQTWSIPYHYTLEIASQNTVTSASPGERTQLSVLYQY